MLGVEKTAASSIEIVVMVMNLVCLFGLVVLCPSSLSFGYEQPCGVCLQIHSISSPTGIGSL
jgi:hypothetical protein